MSFITFPTARSKSCNDLLLIPSSPCIGDNNCAAN